MWWTVTQDASNKSSRTWWRMPSNTRCQAGRGFDSSSGTKRGARPRSASSDTGIGIAPDLMPQVFDLFMQGERGLDRAQGGLESGSRSSATSSNCMGDPSRREATGRTAAVNSSCGFLPLHTPVTTTPEAIARASSAATDQLSSYSCSSSKTRRDVRDSLRLVWRTPGIRSSKPRTASVRRRGRQAVRAGGGHHRYRIAGV